MVTDRSCNNKLVTIRNSLYSAENLKWLTELREWKTYKNVKCVQQIKCVIRYGIKLSALYYVDTQASACVLSSRYAVLCYAKVRALFPENRLRFARAEQVCTWGSRRRGSGATRSVWSHRARPSIVPGRDVEGMRSLAPRSGDNQYQMSEPSRLDELRGSWSYCDQRWNLSRAQNQSINQSIDYLFAR